MKKDNKKDEIAVSNAATAEGDAIGSGSEDSESSSYARSGFSYGVYRFIKRLFDIFSSLAVMIVLSPLILFCILVKWVEDLNRKYCKLEIKEVTSDGKENKGLIERSDGKLFECKIVADPEKKNKGSRAPIYSSLRVGKGGKLFKFHKIRSMCPGADAMKQQLIDAGLNEADPPAFKMKDDPRITKFGKLIRKLSFDELPQLFDIFIGKMSVVGPRPPLPNEVKEYTAYQKHRLDVKGGLLCLWQIQENKNSLSFDEWVELDIKYIREQSLWLDIKIIFKMIKNILTHKGNNS